MQAMQRYAQPGVNAAAIAQMFGRPANSNLYLPERPSFQVVAADVDQDGDEDKYAIRYTPVTLKAGKTLATTGGEGDVEFEPQKWCQLLSFECLKEEVSGINVTNFVIGQEPMFPSKAGYAMPLGLWSEEFQNKLFDAPWIGPNVPLVLSLQNKNTSEVTIWFGARVRVIVA